MRVGFSFLSNRIVLMSIAPTDDPPTRRTVNAVLDDIRAGLPACRQAWWASMGTVCLEQQWLPQSDQAFPISRRGRAARQVAQASYDPASNTLLLTFRDGTTSQEHPPS